MKKKRIRFTINTLEGGGAEKVLVDLLNQLSPEMFDLSLFVVHDGIHLQRLTGNVDVKQLVKCRNKKIAAFLGRIVFAMPNWMFCFLFLREAFDVEVAYLEGTPTQRIAALKTKAKKVAFVHQDMSIDYPTRLHYGSTQACLNAYRSFDKVCFVSKLAKTAFDKTIGELHNSMVLHNVLDVNDIMRKADEDCSVSFCTTGMRLISVGRLAEPKNYSRLLRVIHRLEKEHEMELWIVGEGGERERLEGMIQEMGIQSVRLMGFRANPYSLMKKADLFVCSSNYEGYSTAVTEAVLLGVPVLTTRCAGMDEILCDGEYGLIVDNDDDDALCDGLQALLENHSMYSELKQRVLIRSEELKNEATAACYEKMFSELE